MVRPAVNHVAMVLAIATVGVSFAAAKPGSSTAAVWVPHAIIVDLDSLPKRYSCDDLWYRFRAVLLAVGAQPTRIMPYHCDSRSPSVEMQFSIPRAVQGAEVRYSELQAVNDTIVLEPGRPAPINAADCELMRQITDELFPTLPVQVVGSELNCVVPQTSHQPFRVSLQALLPESQDTQATPNHSSTPTSSMRASTPSAAKTAR